METKGAGALQRRRERRLKKQRKYQKAYRERLKEAAMQRHPTLSNEELFAVLECAAFEEGIPVADLRALDYHIERARERVQERERVATRARTLEANMAAEENERADAKSALSCHRSRETPQLKTGFAGSASSSSTSLKFRTIRSATLR